MERKMTSRREMLRQMAALGAFGAGATLFNHRALAETSSNPRFLIVLAASGGGSIPGSSRWRRSRRRCRACRAAA